MSGRSVPPRLPGDLHSVDGRPWQWDGSKWVDMTDAQVAHLLGGTVKPV